MKIIIQRVSESSVSIKGEAERAINEGLILFVGFCPDDKEEDILWGAHKVINMKILKGLKPNVYLNTLEKQTEILIISQFTLFASTKKGNKPSWHKAANQKKASFLYERFIAAFRKMYLSENLRILLLRHHRD